MSTPRLIRGAIALISFALAAELGAAPRDEAPRTVTLITGDQITISGPQHALSIQRAAGREHIRFITRTQTEKDGTLKYLSVIPEDAVPLIAKDKLDDHLFDIAALIEADPDDSGRDSVPIIVTYPRQTFVSRSSAALLSAVGVSAGTVLTSANATALKASRQQTQKLWSAIAASGDGARAAGGDSAIQKVWLDRMLKPTLDRSVPQIGAPAAWAAGYTGQGVIVGVIDTGVDLTHPDLADRVIATRNFTSDVDDDIEGHGTHVSSIIGGSGAASNGRYKGVAPDVKIVVAKACAISGCPSSSVIAGMEWAVIEKHAQVLNLSLGGTDTPGVDPMEAAVNRLSAEYGVLIAAAAGNSPRRPVGSPASADAAIAVGAIDRNEQIAPFSSSGPRVGDKAIKPDITGPGVGIVAAWAANTSSEGGIPMGDRYIAFSGTSMATPHVAGAAAILRQRFPNYSSAQIKAVLMGTALPNPTATAFQQGSGRVDVAAAVNAKIVANPVNANFGASPFPHDDDVPISRTITYQSISDTDTTVSFLFEISDPNGNAVPQGMFTATPQTLTIPAGGSANVTMTVNTRIDAPNGTYAGELVAIDSSNAARPMASSVPIAVEREGPAYNLTLHHIDRLGQDAESYFTVITPVDDPTLPDTRVDIAPGDVTVRLPPARYSINTSIATLSDNSSAVFVQPVLDLQANTRVTLDARAAEPITLNGPSSSAQQIYTEVGWRGATTYGGSFGFDFFVGGPGNFYSSPLGDSLSGFSFHVTSQWTATRTDSNGITHPEIYAGFWPYHDAVPLGLTQSIDPKRMAVVRAKYLAARPDVNRGVISLGGGFKDSFFSRVASAPLPLPYERTEYYTVGPEGAWENSLALFTNNREVGTMTSRRYSYPAARRYHHVFMEAPYAMPNDSSQRLVRRWSDDFLELRLPMFGDKVGHSGTFDATYDVKLFKNGALIGEDFNNTTFLEMAPEPGDYRVEATAVQQSFELSKSTRYVWTFPSQNIGDVLLNQSIPVYTLQFEPNLNENSESPRGAVTRIPITVAWDGSTRSVNVNSLTADVSFDDGVSWQSVPVRRDGHQWYALVRNPLQGSYVSLRAHVSDGGANSFEETVIRAYALK